jgi:nucleoid-associated protein YgaU
VIARGSRYERTGAYDATDADGRPVKALRIRFVPPTPAGFLHTFKAGERLDLLAYAYYRNPEKFWLIADANDELDPDDLLVPGRQLRVPPDRTT